MTVLVQNIRRVSATVSLPAWQGSYHRIAAIAVLIALTSITADGWHIALEAMSEAYLAVSVFVAATLALVYAAERAFKTDLGVWLQQYKRWQVPAAALLGAFPGCGGAIIAITQYSRGYLSFGGVVATLTATMGDAMFLLLAREPQTAVGILVLSVIVGVISGYIVDAIHGQDFMRAADAKPTDEDTQPQQIARTGLTKTERFWVSLMVPGVVIGILAAFQVDVDQWLAQWTTATPAFWLGATGAVLAVAMWIKHGGENNGVACNSEAGCEAIKPSVTKTVIHNTNFVSAWVVFAFVGYEVMVAATGFDLAAAFNVWGPMVPAIAVLIGFIPGCGPQILVTSMYVTGTVPLSAQIGNAMANDGDALFPAIATAPKAALMATVYSAIPALVAGYAWYLLME